MKVTLVQAPRWSIYTPSYAVALLSGNLRSRGFTVFPKCYDVEFHRAVSPEEKRLWLDENAAFWNDEKRVFQMLNDYSTVVDHLVDDILQDQPDVVGFSVKLWSEVFSLEMARRLKSRRRDVYVVLGGPQISQHEPQAFLAAHAEVDALCRQEADISFPRFLEQMQQNQGRPQPEPGFAFRDAAGAVVDCGLIREIPDVATIPFADYSDFDLSEYLDKRAVTMVLSRGCINRCSYCSEAPSFLRFRACPPQRVFDEIVHHWNTTNSTHPMRVYLNDSLINGNMQQLEALADLLIAHRDQVQIEYGGMMFIRDELTDPALVDKLARSGLVDVLFGLESGSEIVLERMRKRFKLSTAEEVFKQFHEHKISVVATAMFGHPGESEAEFHKSLDFLRRNAHHVDLFLLGYLGLYGDCDVKRHPEKYGIDPSNLQPNDWVADEGRNTFEVRLNRTNIARLALGHKVADHGGFVLDTSALYDPATPHKERIAELEYRVAELEREVLRCEELRKESIRVRNLVVPKQEDPPLGFMDSLITHGTGWSASGWARDPAEVGRPAREVVLMNQNGRIVSYGRVRFARVDVQQTFQSDRLLESGWEATFETTDLDSGNNIVRAFVFQPERETAYQLYGEFAVACA